MSRAGGWRGHALGLVLVVGLLAPRILAAQAQAQDQQQTRSTYHWTTGNIALAGAYAAAVWIDLAQTRFFLKSPHWQESNPILGKHPSSLKVNLLGLAGVTAMIGAGHVVRNPWRSILLAVGTAIELRVIAYNSTGGVGIRLF